MPDLRFAALAGRFGDFAVFWGRREFAAAGCGPTALTRPALLFTICPRSRSDRRSEKHGHRDHSRDRGRGAAISFERPAGQALDRADQAADDAARAVARLFAGGGVSLPAHRAAAERGLR